MSDEMNAVGEAVSMGAPLFKPLVDAVLAPKFAQVTEWLKGRDTERKLLQHQMSSALQSYLQRTYDKYSIINTLAFPNRQVRLADVYYPMYLRVSGTPRVHRAERFDVAFFREYNRLLISDQAGMGKSTITRWLCLSAIEERRAVPVYVELRKLRSDHGLLDEIFRQIDPLEKVFDRELLIRLLELGEFIFFLDGYDEIVPEHHDKVISSIQEFCLKAGNNIFVITSRPEVSLVAFGDFRHLTIEPLRAEQAFGLLRRYDAIGGLELSDLLIAEIRSELRQVSDFLVNPLLVTLLYQTYVHSRNIPSRTVTFYQEMYHALYKQHDLTKDAYKRVKRSGLDLHDFRIVLRRLAFDTLRLGRIEFSRPELAEHVENAKARCAGLSFNVDDFCHDLVLAVPIFMQDGLTTKWVHRSLQDYFAAEFIAFNEQKPAILRKIYALQSPRYLNMLRHFFDLDFSAFRSTVMQKIASEFVEFCDTTYRDLLTRTEGNQARHRDMLSDIRQRQALTYGLDLHLAMGPIETEASLQQLDTGATYSYRVFHIPRHHQMVAVIVGVSLTAHLVQLVISRAGVLGSSQTVYDRREHPPLDDVTIFPDYPLHLNDDRINTLNREPDFSAVNALLAGLRGMLWLDGNRIYLLDLEKCQQFLAALAAEAGGLQDDLSGF